MAQDSLSRIPRLNAIENALNEELYVVGESEKNLSRDIVYEDTLINEQGAIIRLSKVLFEGGTSFLYKQAGPELDKLKNFMLKNPNVIIEIRGHICCITTGNDSYDPETGQRDLSVQRAKRVFKYLVKSGISKDRMTYVGYGSSNKIFLNDYENPEAALLNRRVEIKIISE